MSPLVPVAIYGWVPAVLVVFALLPPRRAVVISFLAAWMFLPMAGFKLAEGVPEINKISVTCLGALLGTTIFDPGRFARLRPTTWDLPILTWLLVPYPSAVANGFGSYEGFAGIISQTVSWGLPYLIGRLYFSDAAGLRELAVGMFVGGLVYVPLVLFEARMSPQLHTWVYGFHQHTFAQARRGDGWRPTVFMQHGLAVAMFMGTAALCGVWLWAAGKMKAIRNVPVWALACGLFATAAACRSTYALMLMLAGTAALFASRFVGTKWILVAMLAIAPGYIVLRTVGGWDARLLRDTSALMGEDRTGSLDVRLESEDVCWRWVRNRPLFGGGRLEEIMGRDEETNERFIPDGLWLIAMGKYGLVGLAAMLGVLLVPPALYLARFPVRELLGLELAGATALAMVLVLYAMDNLLNAMVNPIFLLGAGGLVGFCRRLGPVERGRWRRVAGGSLRGATAL
jgi:hypothetical protein